MANKHGQMALFMSDLGVTIKLTEKVDYNMQMAMYTMESGKTIRLTVKVLILMQTGLDMKANGKKIVSMGVESKHGQMALSMKDSILKGRNTAKENYYSLMGARTKEIL